VVVIGGGDTGSDCIGTSLRQGAASVTNFELMPQPPAQENKALTWPNWPMKLRTSSSHEEGRDLHTFDRGFSIATQRLSGKDGRVTTLHAVKLELKDGKMQEIRGTEFEVKADLVLLAMGYVHPVHEGMLKELGVGLDARGNVKADTHTYQTTISKVFAAGDIRRGQSLIVWAIREGRQAARAVDEFLMGSSDLPR
jgi:glutamate synthase (NADPH/NADH) small chain